MRNQDPSAGEAGPAAPFAAFRPDEFGELVAEIYDCATSPRKWRLALDRVCRRGRFTCAFLYILDPVTQTIALHRCFRISGADAAAPSRPGEVMVVTSELFASLPHATPRLLSRDVPRERYVDSPSHLDWLKTQGLVDIMQIPFATDDGRSGAICFGRRESHGPFGDDEIAMATLLQPHLSRALALSRLFEMQKSWTHGLRSIVRNLSTPTILVTRTGAILEANKAARSHFDHPRFIHEREGRLGAVRPRQGDTLIAAIRSAAASPKDNPDTAVILGSIETGFAVAHVLPLIDDGVKHHPEDVAAAAVLLTSDASEQSGGPRAQLLARVYELTAAEQRVAEALASGQSSIEAAKLLGISEGTIRTHLTRIFGKTGVSRQSELVALMHRLAPPLHGAKL